MIDAAVRWNGALWRLVMSGDSGALAAPGKQSVAVVKTGAGRFGVPEVAADGTVLALTRAPKPCSCKGAPWNQGAQDVLASVPVAP